MPGEEPQVLTGKGSYFPLTCQELDPEGKIAQNHRQIERCHEDSQQHDSAVNPIGIVFAPGTCGHGNHPCRASGQQKDDPSAHLRKRHADAYPGHGCSADKIAHDNAIHHHRQLRG